MNRWRSSINKEFEKIFLLDFPEFLKKLTEISNNIVDETYSSTYKQFKEQIEINGYNNSLLPLIAKLRFVAQAYNKNKRELEKMNELLQSLLVSPDKMTFSSALKEIFKYIRWQRLDKKLQTVWIGVYLLKVSEKCKNMFFNSNLKLRRLLKSTKKDAAIRQTSFWSKVSSKMASVIKDLDLDSEFPQPLPKLKETSETLERISDYCKIVTDLLTRVLKCKENNLDLIDSLSLIVSHVPHHVYLVESKYQDFWLDLKKKLFSVLSAWEVGETDLFESTTEG